MSARRWHMAALAAVFVAAALVRVALAGRQGLWADEVFSLAMATGHSLEHPAAAADPARGDFVEPPGPMGAREPARYVEHETPPESPWRVVRAVLHSDTSPPLYYLLLHVWTRLAGTGDMALRAFSIVCSLACLPLIAGVARQVAGRGAVLGACVFFAFAPPSVYYSTEGRMYALLWLLVVAAAWLALALRVRGGRPALLAGWIAVSAAGFLTHYFFVFPWAALVAFLALRPGALSRARLAAAIGIVVLAIVPWYVHVPETLGRWRVTGDWLKTPPADFHRLAALRDVVFGFFSGRATDLWFDRPKGNIAALLLCAGVLGAWLWRLRGAALGGRRLVVWLWFAAACLGPVAFDLAQGSYTITRARYALAGLPAAAVLVGAGSVCLGPRLRTAVIALLVLVWTPVLVTIFRNPARSWSPLREVARMAGANTTATDLILIHSIPSGAIGVARYLETPAPVACWVGQLGQRRVPESIEALVAGRASVRFVKIHHVGAPDPEVDWLRAHAIEETIFAPPGSGEVRAFRPRDGTLFGASRGE